MKREGAFESDISARRPDAYGQHRFVEPPGAAFSVPVRKVVGADVDDDVFFPAGLEKNFGESDKRSSFPEHARVHICDIDLGDFRAWEIACVLEVECDADAAFAGFDFESVVVEPRVTEAVSERVGRLSFRCVEPSVSDEDALAV